MTRLTRLIWFTTLSTVVGSVLLMWAGALTVLADTPQGTVRIAFHNFSKESMHPAQDGGPGLVYHGQMFNNFIGATVESKLTTDYGVLERYESNADATIWTFVLKKGITWHDGAEMTADDLKFSIDHYAEPTTQCGQCGAVRANLDRVEVVDRSTVRLYLRQADTGIPVVFGPLEGNFMVLPKHHYEKVGASGFENTPLGSGPWRFVKREIGQYIEYETNLDYWQPARVPDFAKLRMMLVPESRTRVAMLKRGEAELISLEPQDVAPLKKEGYKILGPKDAGTTILLFYRSYDPTFPTHELEFRKALILGVDWDAVVKAFYPPEVGERQSGGAPLFSRVTLGYDPEITPYPNNPEEAKRLLKAAGYTGEKIIFWNFFFTANPEQLEVNEVIASYWHKLDLNVELATIDYSAFHLRGQSRPQKFDPPAPVGVQFPCARPWLMNNIRSFMLSHQDGGSTWAYWNPEKAEQLFTEVSAIVDVDARDRR